MRFRKIVLALFACMALGAVAANAAQAGWTIEGVSPFPSSEKVSCEKHGSEALTLTSSVLGTPITLTATGIACEEGTIDNTVEEGHSQGFLNFTGVTVSPSTCSVPGGNVTTNKLTDKVIMDPTAGSTVVFDKFFTDSGPFVEITLQGAECPFNGITAPVTGSACGEAAHTSGSSWVANKTGELLATQTLRFGAAQQTTGGCELKLGKAAATLSGAVDNKLSGPNVGKAFGDD